MARLLFWRVERRIIYPVSMVVITSIVMWSYWFSNYRAASVLFSPGEFSERALPIAKDGGLDFIVYAIEEGYISKEMWFEHSLYDLVDNLSLQDLVELDQRGDFSRDSDFLPFRIIALLVDYRLGRRIEDERIESILSDPQLDRASSQKSITNLLLDMYAESPENLIKLAGSELMESYQWFCPRLVTALSPHGGEASVVEQLKLLLQGDPLCDGNVLDALEGLVSREQFISILAELEMRRSLSDERDRIYRCIKQRRTRWNTLSGYSCEFFKFR